MRTDTSFVDRRVARELCADGTLGDEHRDELWRRVDAALGQPARRGSGGGRRPARRSPAVRAVLVAVALLLVLGGMALAAEPGIVDRIFGADDPAPSRVDQFANPDVDRATQAEYDHLQSMTKVPGVKRTGVLRDDEMVQKYRLAGIDRSRVVADDPSVGRLVSVPMVGDTNLCYIYTPPGGKEPNGGGCGIVFDSVGLSTTWHGQDPDRGDASMLYGIASDDVERVEVELRGGGTEPVALVENAFYWRARSSDVTAVRIATWRGGERAVTSAMPGR